MITINVRKSTRCNGDNSLYVSFPYDSNIVNIIRLMKKKTKFQKK